MIVSLDGEKIRAMREESWLSREELASEAGIGLTTLRNIEKEKTGVRLATARKLARALGVAPKSLSESFAERQPESSEAVSTVA